MIKLDTRNGGLHYPHLISSYSFIIVNDLHAFYSIFISGGYEVAKVDVSLASTTVNFPLLLDFPDDINDRISSKIYRDISTVR